ncbi:hypothetical protein BDV38DRAFT_240915 [Aspergillus pseudotamarii]|uniref:Uncharacterized protein n=1 Tax=Aspergillus pseudotamarii TaxID=132259 RepID=A0A5N6T197_ASPPS|nr:uncharacterized protein BDV38DRAFT_240915 [Aspergillus pseudotamarii]KAE8140059.1 hypothetical protein BDV38DRAFT_240915 [Aspergillus pseudotamarii]
MDGISPNPCDRVPYVLMMHVGLSVSMCMWWSMARAGDLQGCSSGMNRAFSMAESGYVCMHLHYAGIFTYDE